MKIIYVKTTESCNLACKHCYINDFRKNTYFFDQKKTKIWIQKYLNQFNNQKILINFHGGQPFLCDLNKIQYICQSFPLAIKSATSNLINFNSNILSLILKYFNDPVYKKPFIKSSWDYKIRFKYNQQQIWENNVKILLQNNVYTKIIICLTSILIKEIQPINFLQYFSQLGISEIDFERLTDNTTEDKSLIPDYIQQNMWLQKIYQLNKIYKLKIGLFENIKYAANNIYIGCRNRSCMKDVITINANGSIGGCPNIALLYPFSSINQQPKQLFNNQLRKKLIKQQEHKNNQCYSCNFYQYCNGDCFQLSWQNNICPMQKNILIKYLNKQI